MVWNGKVFIPAQLHVAEHRPAAEDGVFVEVTHDGFVPDPQPRFDEGEHICVVLVGECRPERLNIRKVCHSKHEFRRPRGLLEQSLDLNLEDIFEFDCENSATKKSQ